MGNSDDDSDLAEYGTALEPIEEDDASRKRPIAVSDQIAVDERGRRRFHGAFTGGFSAGYFNTVGSKEGWAPSNFKSTRADRGSFKSQNVLDFMDDEDKGAFGIAPQILRPTEDFVDKNETRGRKRPWTKDAEGSIPGASVLEQILQPAHETVGIKILIKMGWRPGKGVGPRIDKRAKRPRIPLAVIESTESTSIVTSESDPTSEGDKFYGCSLPPEIMQQRTGDSESSSDEIEEAKTLLAPDDVNSLLCNPKENTFGLGYKGLDRNTLAPATGDIDLYGTKLKFRVENKNLSISGQAFGVGAFEENDDDIYSKEDMSQYDFALETPEERKRRKAKEDLQKRKKKNKENCMEGFRASTSNKIRRKSYPAPHLPPNFQPFHAVKKSRFEISKSSSEIDEKQDAMSKGLARHSLSITERQVLIEDDVNKMTLLKKPAATQSDIETETKSAEDIQLDHASSSKPLDHAPSENDIKYRIERLKKFTQVLQAYSSKPPEASQNAAFKPFMKNPEKQERYEKFLTLRDAGFSECLKDLQPAEMTEWEREREKMEFERASKLYQPMNSILANRFVSAKSHDISHLEPEREIIPEKDPNDDPKVAARMKLFGKLTHRMMEWHPDKLVCKRFNIPHPYPDSKFVGVKGDPSAWGIKSNSIANQTVAKPAEVEIAKKKSLFDNLDFSKPPPGLLPQKAAQVSSSTGSPMECSAEASVLEFQIDISDANKVSSAHDVEIVERPSLDLFKEIFADSSESENEAEEAEVPDGSKEKDSQQFILQHMPREKGSSVRDDKRLDKVISSNNAGNSFPPENESVNQQRETQKRGVFDRIDLDMLQNNAQRLQSSNRKPSRCSSESGDDEEMNGAYGPAPPKNPYHSTSRPLQSGSSLSAKYLGSAPAPMYQTYQSKLDDRKKEMHTEEVIWVEKSALSDGNSKSHVKSKKHSSSKKSRRKSNKKEKHKSHKSKKSKHKKKGRKHKSKSKKDSGESSGSGDDSASGSDASSDSSVTINDSLDNRALLAKLKKITRSN